MKTTKQRALIFWSGFGWCVADMTTQTEIAGPFELMHSAFLCAHERGLLVADVTTTRGHVKRKLVEPEVVT